MDAAAIIEQFGGPTNFAKALGVATGRVFTVPVVCNWVHRGVPWRWRPVVEKLPRPKRRKRAA